LNCYTNNIILTLFFPSLFNAANRRNCIVIPTASSNASMVFDAFENKMIPRYEEKENKIDTWIFKEALPSFLLKIATVEPKDVRKMLDKAPIFNNDHVTLQQQKIVHQLTPSLKKRARIAEGEGGEGEENKPNNQAEGEAATDDDLQSTASMKSKRKVRLVIDTNTNDIDPSAPSPQTPLRGNRNRDQNVFFEEVLPPTTPTTYPASPSSSSAQGERNLSLADVVANVLDDEHAIAVSNTRIKQHHLDDAMESHSQFQESYQDPFDAPPLSEASSVTGLVGDSVLISNIVGAFSGAGSSSFIGSSTGSDAILRGLNSKQGAGAGASSTASRS